jgi:hypothetical protein
MRRMAILETRHLTKVFPKAAAGAVDAGIELARVVAAAESHRAHGAVGVVDRDERGARPHQERQDPDQETADNRETERKREGEPRLTGPPGGRWIKRLPINPGTRWSSTAS